MVGDAPRRYVALSQASATRRPWWQRIPEPVEMAALHLWGALPGFIRASLVPFGRLFGPHSIAVPMLPGPETVPGVVDLIRQGFEPIESHTGAVWVGALWPDQHRRSVQETRPWWLDDPDADGQLWLVRSPWDSLTTDDVFAVLWRWVERDRTLDEQIQRERVAEVMAWTEARAVQQLRASTD